MNIDYYCFPTKTGDLSVFMNLDQYFSDERFFYQCAQEDVLLAKAKGKLLLFDLRNHTFIDENGNEVNISEKVIFPRSKIQEANILMEYLEKTDAKPITSRKDYSTIENWFNIIKTTRDFEQITFGEIMGNLSKYKEKYGSSFFLKTVQKGFSDIFTIIETMVTNEDGTKEKMQFLTDSTFHAYKLMRCDNDTKLLISKTISVNKDEYGKREWRAFVVNNELLCLSRFSDDVVPIEDYVYENVNSKIKEFEGKIPASYVVDFFEYTNENNETIFDVVEFNPIISSGVFQNNDLVF